MKPIVIKAPDSIQSAIESGKFCVFLAGSIEMGGAENWQDIAEQNLKCSYIFNPRRVNWNSSWEQNVNNKKFVEQVEWELDALTRSNLILMYFDPNTKSPISLLELGLWARSGKLIVVCPEGFWRKGNVDVVCKKYKIVQKSSLNEAIEYINERTVMK